MSYKNNIYKFNYTLHQLKTMITLRTGKYSLRGTNILTLPKPNTTTYDLNSFQYFATKTWNSFPESIRTELSFNEFKNKPITFLKL